MLRRASLVLIALGFVALALAAACPGPGPGPVEPQGGGTAQPAGDAAVPPPDIAPPPPPPPPPAEYSGDPGTLAVTVTFNGDPVDGAEVQVHRTGQAAVETSKTLSDGQTDASFDLPPGRYDVTVPFPGAVDHMVDGQEGVRIETGGTKRVSITFDALSQVTLDCKRGGHNQNGTIRLRRTGATDYLPEVHCGQEFLISGGEWEAEVTIGSAHSGVQINTTLHIQGGGRVHTPIMIEGGGSHH